MARAKRAAPGKKEPACNPRYPEDDPYRELRVPEDDSCDPANDEYIWPVFEDDDEDRI